MITYPYLKSGATIGVTAPSSGVKAELHDSLRAAFDRMRAQGFSIICGDTVWTQDKAKSSPARIRAEEFNAMAQDDAIGLIFPPWGGELLIEILEHIDFDLMKNKWVLGYSDISLLLLAITLKTGTATAHGTCLFDLRGAYSDETTAMWQQVLSTKAGESILQQSSPSYQKEWPSALSPYIFQLTEPTYWRTVSGSTITLRGRLLGGCIDVIRHLIGTPYGDLRYFQKHFINGEPLIWYLENCELNAADMRRSLVQMKLAGWFDHCSGLLFGRSNANQPYDNYTEEDVYQDLFEELGIPVIYDIDCGHVPPQITFINGAYAEIAVEDGRGTVTQYFKA